MKTEKHLDYEPPQVEVVEVEIEKGFAGSVGSRVNDWGNGGSLGNHDVE